MIEDKGLLPMGCLVRKYNMFSNSIIQHIQLDQKKFWLLRGKTSRTRARWDMGKWLEKLATVWITIVWHIQYPTDQWQDGNSIKAWRLSPIQRFSIVQKDESRQYPPLLMLLILDVMGIREMWHLWRSPFIEDTFPDPGTVTGRCSACLSIKLIVLL